MESSEVQQPRKPGAKSKYLSNFAIGCFSEWNHAVSCTQRKRKYNRRSQKKWAFKNK